MSRLLYCLWTRQGNTFGQYIQSPVTADCLGETPLQSKEELVDKSRVHHYTCDKLLTMHNPITFRLRYAVSKVCLSPHGAEI